METIRRQPILYNLKEDQKGQMQDGSSSLKASAYTLGGEVEMRLELRAKCG